MDYVESLPMPIFNEASMAMFMQKARSRVEMYDAIMHPWIKNDSKRAKLFSRQQKNSEMYLDKSDNIEDITTESIFKKLTRGQNFGKSN